MNGGVVLATAPFQGGSARLLLWFVLASGPAALAGAWGDESRFMTFLGQLAVALITGALWARLFARLQRTPPDPGWLVCGWLFALLVPPATPLILVAVAMSFGVVLGHHLFGGTGRALVNPALLGVLVIHFGYPQFAATGMTLQDMANLSETQPWWRLALLGMALPNPGASIGATAPLACLLGGLLLSRSGAASPRVMLGGVAGVVLGSVILGAGADDPLRTLSPLTHLLTGQLAFCLVFIATDPSTGALTRAGRWAHGVLLGLFAVLIRLLDPGHPDGTLFATLMAGLAVPLADHLALRSRRRP